MAEEVVVDARHVLPVPEGLSLHEAAAIPEVYATAWLNLFQLAGLKPGEKVLLHAGASGVGSAGIQLCKAFGSPVWVSVIAKEWEILSLTMYSALPSCSRNQYEA
jgi:NADPH:quinone reductase-like Zn-dependent oxidoreductase